METETKTPPSASPPVTGHGASGGAINFRQTLTSLKYRNYRYLWIGQLGSSGANWMEIVARGWLIYEMTNSPFLLGLTAAMKALPMLFVGVFGGVLVDRMNRRNLLIFSQVSNMFLNLIIGVLIVTGLIQPWHVIATSFVSGIVMAVQQPTRQAMIPNLVPRQDLLNAVALNSAAMQIMRSVGPAIAGFAVAGLGMASTYFFQAGLLIFAALLTAPIQLPPSGASVRRASMADNLKEGFSYVRSNETVLTLLILALIPMVLGMPYSSIMPIFAKDVLNIGPEGLGFLMAAPGIGAFIGVTLIASLNNFHRKGLLLLIGASLFGAALVAFSASQLVISSLLILTVVGFANSSYMAVNNTLLQIHTPDELRGRVMSIFLLDRGLQPLGTLLVGTMADFIGGPIALSIMGALVFFLAIGVAFTRPSVRSLA